MNKFLRFVFWTGIIGMISVAFNTGVTGMALGIVLLLYCVCYCIKFEEPRLGVYTLVAAAAMFGIVNTLLINPLVFPIIRTGYFDVLADAVVVRYQPADYSHSYEPLSGGVIGGSNFKWMPDDLTQGLDKEVIKGDAFIIFPDREYKGAPLSTDYPERIAHEVGQNCSWCEVKILRKGDRVDVTGVSIMHGGDIWPTASYSAKAKISGTKNIEIQDWVEYPYVLQSSTGNAVIYNHLINYIACFSLVSLILGPLYLLLTLVMLTRKRDTGNI